jgi:iron complex transport system ATP-binding protein
MLAQALALSDCQTLLEATAPACPAASCAYTWRGRAPAAGQQATQRYLLLDEPTAALDIGANQQLASPCGNWRSAGSWA